MGIYPVKIRINRILTGAKIGHRPILESYFIHFLMGKTRVLPIKKWIKCDSRNPGFMISEPRQNQINRILAGFRF